MSYLSLNKDEGNFSLIELLSIEKWSIKTG